MATSSADIHTRCERADELSTAAEGIVAECDREHRILL